MSSVIDMKTRRPWQIEPEPRQPTDADRVAALIQSCEDAAYTALITIRHTAGLDAALQAQGRINQELRGSK